MLLFQPADLRFVHTFLSIPKFREVDTAPFISHLRKFPQIQIAVPRVDLQSKEVTHHLYCESDLVVSSWGISEPSESSPTLSPEQFDMVLVPMLAFDRFRHRLGYGGGYYDRFLSRVRPDCVTVGLCFDLGYVESKLPSQSYDGALDMILTESRTL